MRRPERMIAAVCAALLVMTGPVRAAEIGDFLTGGAGSSSAAGTAQGADDNGAPEGDSVQPSVVAQSLSMVTCTDNQTGIHVARAVVPGDYSVTSQTSWCGPCQSPDYPAEVFITAEAPDGSIQLTYESLLEFVQCLNASVNGMQIIVHQDWTISTDYLMMMLTYMNAQQYCDYVAQQCMKGASGVTLISESPVPQEVQAKLQQVSRQKLDEVNQVLDVSQGIYVDYVETMAAERTYRYTDNYGKSRILVVSTATQAVRLNENISAYGMGQTSITNLIWSVPYRYCLMVDEDKYEEGLSVFASFCTNTTISDQFKKAMADLSRQITSAVTNARATAMSQQAGYVQDTFSSELGAQEDTYTSTEAWDDAILDRSDYTLSSGDSVKVDTSYDYVYELSDGSVYATQSALDEPAGSTRLYAN